MGKDTIRRILESEYYGYENIVSHTSRPMRENEIDGNDYHFISKKEFEDMIDNNEMIEYRSYTTSVGGNIDTWFYGVKKFELQEHVDYVIVMDLVGAENIIKYFGKENCMVVYLDVFDGVREIRARERGSFDETEWKRRLVADSEDFSSIKLRDFMYKHKMWHISNNIRGEEALNEIAGVINFIVEGRLLVNGGNYG